MINNRLNVLDICFKIIGAKRLKHILQFNDLPFQYVFDVTFCYLTFLRDFFDDQNTKTFVIMTDQSSIICVGCCDQALELVKNCVLTISIRPVVCDALTLYDIEYLQRVVSNPFEASGHSLKAFILKVHSSHVCQPFLDPFDHVYFLFANKISRRGLEPALQIEILCQTKSAPIVEHFCICNSSLVHQCELS